MTEFTKLLNMIEQHTNLSVNEKLVILDQIKLFTTEWHKDNKLKIDKIIKDINI